MPQYVRANFPGGFFFFTVITYNRRELFAEDLARKCLRNAWHEIEQRRPFETIAICLLPEHIHCIWKLPQGDSNFSQRWASIKAVFTREYLKGGGQDGIRKPTRQRAKEAAIWQRRFWEHQIRDENDLQKHIDYIHYNPVKHELVKNVDDWPWSTYHRFLKEGFYGGCKKSEGLMPPEDFNCAGE